jgi:hypothetical protein
MLKLETRIICKWGNENGSYENDRIIVSNDNCWEHGGCGKEMGASIERILANLKETL